jgi:hypothetical protein
MGDPFGMAGNGPERDGIAPHFRDLVVRLRHDLDRSLSLS